MLGAIGRHAHLADIHKSILSGNLLFLQILTQQKDGPAVHSKQISVLPARAEIPHLRQPQIAAALQIKLLLILSVFRHTEPFLIKSSSGSFFKRMSGIPQDQQLRSAEAEDRVVPGRLGSLTILVAQTVRRNILNHHSRILS